MKLMHLCLCGPYSDDYEYQDNILPLKHHEMGYEVKVLVSQETWEKGGVRGIRAATTYINKHNYEVTIVPFKKSRYAIRYKIFEGLYDEIIKFKPDILFCHGGLTFSYKDIIKYLKQNPQTDFFIDSHVDYNITGIMYLKGLHRYKRVWLYKYVWGHCIRKLSKYAKKVWGVTPARVDFLKEVFKIPESKVDLLVMGGNEKEIDYKNSEIYRKKIRDKCGLKNEQLLLITGGKLDRFKNIPNLIKAIRDIPDIHLAIFGTPDEEMKDEINKLIDCSNNITMLGWASPQTIMEYFLGSDLAVFPGRHSVLWEQAVLCGLPCIFLDAYGMHHVDVGGNCAFFENDSIETIHDNILNLVNNKEKINNMRKVANTKGMTTFAYSNIARKAIGVEDHD